MTQVRVPQESGTIKVSAGGATVLDVEVNDHLVEVSDDALDVLFKTISGAEIVPAEVVTQVSQPDTQNKGTKPS